MIRRPLTVLAILGAAALVAGMVGACDRIVVLSPAPDAPTLPRDGRLDDGGVLDVNFGIPDAFVSG